MIRAYQSLQKTLRSRRHLPAAIVSAIVGIAVASVLLTGAWPTFAQPTGSTDAHNARPVSDTGRVPEHVRGQEVNQPPVFATGSITGIMLKENLSTSFVVITYEVTDPESDGLTWSLEGPDKDNLSITENSEGRGGLGTL